jgi:plasmid maintenance system antidote protein VapI
MNESKAHSRGSGFGALFEEAEKRVEFWEEDAIISFTEDVCLAMERAGVSRAELARRLGTSQAYVTKVLRGNANFTIKTMGRLAVALDSELRVHLAPRKSHTYWLDRQPVRPRPATVSSSPSPAAVAPTAHKADSASG